MAVLILPNRAAGVRPPFYGVNWGSLQASNLALWYPITGTTKEMPAHGGVSSTPLAFQTTNTYTTTHPIHRHAIHTVKASPAGFAMGPDSVPVSSEFSLSFWLKWDDVGEWAFPVAKTPDDVNRVNSNYFDWGILFNYTTWYFIRNGGYGGPYDGTAMYQTGWHHWLVTMSSTTGRNACALYVDGKLKQGHVGVGASTTTNNTASRYLQTQYNTTSDIADLRIYNRYLSAADAWALYDPSSRWDLYWQPARRAYIDLGATPVTRAPGLGSATLTGAAGSLAFNPGDYIYSTATPDDEAVVDLTDLQPPGSGTWTMKVRGRVN